MRKINIYSLIVILIIIGSLLLYFFLAQPDDVDIKIGYNVESVNLAPIMIAYDKDIFNKHGLKVRLVPLKSGNETKQALATGQIDIGSAGVNNFFIPISKGAPVKILAPLALSSTYLFVRPDNQIKTLNDLAGKTVAARIGSSSNLALRFALKQEGVDSSNMTFLDINKTYRPIALMEKKIVDAALAQEFMDVIFKQAGAVILEEWVTKGYLKQSLPNTVISVNTDFMVKNLKKTETFIEALVDSHKFIIDNPDESAALVAKHIALGSAGAMEYSVDDIKKTWQNTKYVLWYDPNIFVEASKISREIGDIENELSLEQLFDLSFRSKLEAAQIEVYGPKN